MPGIVSAPAPARLIERGKFGVSVWASVLLDKFLYGRPSHRLIEDLAHRGLQISPGTLAGGLQAIAPLFEPLDRALALKLRSQSHWHADETRWAVFADVAGKVGHRWYLWVFHSSAVVHYVLDESRSTAVIEGELAGVEQGVISCDRYSAYKKFARLHPGVALAFCWAHQRRDFLEFANAYPQLSGWAMGWVDEIGQLYHLNAMRLQAPGGSRLRATNQAALRQAVASMASRRDIALGTSCWPSPQPGAAQHEGALDGVDGVRQTAVGAHGQQRRRARCPAGGGRPQELLRLGVAVVRAIGRHDVQLADDGQAVEAQSAHLAGRVPPGLRRQWRSRAAGARAVSSWAMGATRLAALRAHATVCTVPAQAFDTS